MMNKAEFREGMMDALEAMKDPHDEIHQMVPEGRALANDLRPFDPTLAMKVDAIATAMQDMIDYIKTKSER